MTLRKHYSSAELLEYLDGEARHIKRALVRDHLQRCWSCRTRLQEVEQQIHAATEFFDADGLPGDGWVESGKRQLLSRISDYEMTFAAPLQGSSRSIPWLTIATATASLAVLAAIGYSLRPVRSSTVSPVDFATRSARADYAPAGQVLYQEFLVDLRQSSPAVRERQMKLRLWSDAAEHRFTSRLEDGNGHLRLGLWRASADTYIYREEATQPASLQQFRHSDVLPAAASTLAGSDQRVNDIEIALMDWLESRDWHPVQLGSEMVIAKGGPGDWMTAQLTEKHGRRVLVLTATKVAGTSRITASAEIDPETYRARLQRIQIETSSQRSEILITAVERRVLDRAAITPAVFHPDPAMLRARTPREPVNTRSTEEAIPTPSTDDMDDVEAEVVHALHRVHADLGEPVSVHRDGGHIRVDGLFEFADRKQQVLTALEGLATTPVLQLHLETVQEASAVSADVVATGIGRALAPAESRVGLDDSFRVALKKEIQKQSLLKPLEVDDRVTAIGNRAVAISSETMEAAWALRRLAERFAPAKLTRMRPHSRSLIALVARDLTSLLTADTAELRSTLGPVLQPLANLSEPEASPVAIIPGTGIDAAFKTARRTRDLVHAVFAGRAIDPASQLEVETPGRIANELLVLFGELNQSVNVAGRDMTPMTSNDLATGNSVR